MIATREPDDVRARHLRDLSGLGSAVQPRAFVHVRRGVVVLIRDVRGLDLRRRDSAQREDRPQVSAQKVGRRAGRWHDQEVQMRGAADVCDQAIGENRVTRVLSDELAVDIADDQQFATHGGGMPCERRQHDALALGLRWRLGWLKLTARTATQVQRRRAKNHLQNAEFRSHRYLLKTSPRLAIQVRSKHDCRKLFRRRKE